MKSFKLLFLTLFFSSFCFSQTKNSIGFYTDNDVFVFTGKDRYYSTGIELFWKRLIEKNEGKYKVLDLRITSQVYTPNSTEVPNSINHDRPYAGVLMVEGSLNWHKQNSVLSAGTNLGWVGPSNGMVLMQKNYHKLTGLDPVQGIDFQIEDMLLGQVEASYWKNIFRENKNLLDVSFRANGNFGTIWNNSEVGLPIRIGFKKLKSLGYSVISANVFTEKKQGESFFFIEPILQYRFFDATVSGSIIENESPVTKNLLPWKGVVRFGYYYQSQRWGLTYQIRTESKDLREPVKRHTYGTISINYLF